ncbi:MAG: ribonuclease Z [Halobacteria archaeon]
MSTHHRFPLQVTFLGTAGTAPSAHRNPSAILLSREGELILFDCGEGTQQQMMRAKTGMRALSTICITHFHGDHILGIPGILMTFAFHERQEPLWIVGPRGTQRLVETLSTLGGFQVNFPVKAVELQPGEPLEREGYRILPFKTDHTGRSMGYVLEDPPRPGKFDKPKALALGIPEGPLFGKLQRGQAVALPDGRNFRPEDVLGPSRPGRRVVYTGDTRPCDATVEAARGADLLIHDGTLANDQAEWAREARHSTAAEAAGVAKRAGVHRLVLTHISTRYEENPAALLEEARPIFPGTVIARELATLEVPFRDVEPPKSR